MHLEQQKRQARELLRAIRSGNTVALERLRKHHTYWRAADDTTVRQMAALHDAQFALAREQGFASWPKLKAYAEPASPSRHTRIYMAELAWLTDRVHGLLRTRASAGPAALEQIREWHPRFADQSDHEILQAPFTLKDAQLVYAREHGFATWEELETRVSLLAADPGIRQTEPFLNAFQSLQAGETATFAACLKRHPQLALERGTNGNTLLNLAVSLSKETDAIQTLLAAGADVNDANDRGWTPLHAAAYSNKTDIAALLIEHGAALDAEAHGSGGTPLIAALFWGHREVAGMLEIAPGNLRAAAGLGNLELVAACFDPDGMLKPEASAARGFYRPHSGFPDWRPSPNPQEVLDEALVWACKSGRVNVLERLVRAGANVNADPYQGTPLIWAAVGNHAETLHWLLDHGAQVNQKATFGGLTHGQGITALHMAAQYGNLGAVRSLVERGADLAIQDDLYHATAEGGANYFGKFEVRDYLRHLSLP